MFICLFAYTCLNFVYTLPNITLVSNQFYFALCNILRANKIKLKLNEIQLSYSVVVELLLCRVCYFLYHDTSSRVNICR